MNKTVSVQLFLMFMLIVFGHDAIAATPEVAPRGDSAPFGSPDEIRRMATTGNREAMYLMGQMYESGFGVEQNTLEAFTWFKQAADAGLSKAQNTLGTLYLTGRGTARDEKLAVQWFQRAADAGDGPAQDNLADMYRTGRGGLTRDYGKALYWLEQAASRGYSGSQNNFAWLLATLPEAALRNGSKAIAMMEEQLRQTPANAGFVDTLAAAYAETGQFEKAIRTQQQALSMARDARLDRRIVVDMELRLQGYESGKPWRED